MQPGDLIQIGSARAVYDFYEDCAGHKATVISIHDEGVFVETQRGLLRMVAHEDCLPISEETGSSDSFTK